VDGISSRETGCAQCHGGLRIQTRWHRNDPLTAYARVLRIATVMCLRQAASRYEDFVPWGVPRITGGLDHTREIDTAHQWIPTQDPPRAGSRKRVLIVDVRMCHADDDVAGR